MPAMVLSYAVQLNLMRLGQSRLSGWVGRVSCLGILIAFSSNAQENATQIVTAPLSESDQTALLARVRREALRYQRELPNFLCTQLTTRSVDETGTGKHWKKRDSMEVEDVYVGAFVNHKLIQVNSMPVHKNYQELTGFLSETVLHSVGFLPPWLFGPEAKTTFEWLRESTLDGRRMEVFSVHLSAEDSKFMISTQRHTYIAGVDGVVYIDAMAAVVKRLEIQMDLPPDSVIQEGELQIDYGLVDISERQFFLPVRFDVRAHFGASLVKNETEVVRYRKYAADITIHFDQTLPADPFDSNP
jgi:hypothetical protein